MTLPPNARDRGRSYLYQSHIWSWRFSDRIGIMGRGILTISCQYSPRRTHCTQLLACGPFKNFSVGRICEGTADSGNPRSGAWPSRRAEHCSCVARREICQEVIISLGVGRIVVTGIPACHPTHPVTQTRTPQPARTLRSTPIQPCNFRTAQSLLLQGTQP